jgi:hypothetical protein
VIHIFLVVDGEWVLLVIVDDYSRSCGFLCLGRMRFNLLCSLSGLCLSCGVSKLN